MYFPYSHIIGHWFRAHTISCIRRLYPNLTKYCLPSQHLTWAFSRPSRIVSGQLLLDDGYMTRSTHCTVMSSLSPLWCKIGPSFWGSVVQDVWIRHSASLGDDADRTVGNYDKVGKNIEWGKDSVVNNWCWVNWTVSCQRNNYFPSSLKTSKWIKA